MANPAYDVSKITDEIKIIQDGGQLIIKVKIFQKLSKMRISGKEDLHI